MMPKTMACVVVLLLLGSGCTLGSQVLSVGLKCTSDNDCPEDLECVRADSANADKACMPIDDGGE